MVPIKTKLFTKKNYSKNRFPFNSLMWYNECPFQPDPDADNIPTLAASHQPPDPNLTSEINLQFSFLNVANKSLSLTLCMKYNQNMIS